MLYILWQYLWHIFASESLCFHKHKQHKLSLVNIDMLTYIVIETVITIHQLFPKLPVFEIKRMFYPRNRILYPLFFKTIRNEFVVINAPQLIYLHNFSLKTELRIFLKVSCQLSLYSRIVCEFEIRKQENTVLSLCFFKCFLVRFRWLLYLNCSYLFGVCQET